MGWKKEVRRELDAALARQALNQEPPAPRDAVLLPLVDSLLTAFAGPSSGVVAPQDRCYRRSTAELINEVRVRLHAENIQNIFGIVKPPPAELSFDDIPNVFPQNPGMPKLSERSPYHIEVGARLRRTRKAINAVYEKMNVFATDTGTDEDNLGNWERGVSLTPPEYVRRLKGLFGITFDWIYDGDASTMRMDLTRKLTTQGRRK